MIGGESEEAAGMRRELSLAQALGPFHCKQQKTKTKVVR